MKKYISLVASAIALSAMTAQAQTTWGNTGNSNQQNDSNAPLHLMKPAYRYAYGVPNADSITALIDRIYTYLDVNTHMQVENKNTHEVLTNLKKVDENSQLVRGTFRLTSYEWGVTYSAMLRLGEVTGNKKYTKYAEDRMSFLAEIAPYFLKVYKAGKKVDPFVHPLLDPIALDDCGAICSAMMKAKMANPSLKLDDQISRYYAYIDKGQYRLSDGLFARMRPLKNTIWLDDMFMGIPSLVCKGALDKDNAQLLRAAEQFQLFHKRMWVPEKKLYRHGYGEEMASHPSFFWGRANGWALLTACELLDYLPEGSSEWNTILGEFKEHLEGLVALQGYDGAWHQLLDRNETYLETSCTALYAYCMAHAINKGWIDKQAYGPMTVLAWNYISGQVNQAGEVLGTCVGTGMGFDAAFYAYRPVNKFAAHGYGPVLWAGAEMLQLLKTQHPQLNDSGLHFYDEDPNTTDPIFFLK